MKWETLLTPDGKHIQKFVKGPTKIIKLQAVICQRDITVISWELYGQ